MRFELQVVDGPNVGRRFTVDPGDEVTIGRTHRADQVFSSDAIMSSLHFQLDYQDSTCRLLDLESTNGTFVNGRRVRDATLSQGDTVTAGETVFEVYVLREVIPGGQKTETPTQPTIRGTAVNPTDTQTNEIGEGSVDIGWTLDMDGPAGRNSVILAAFKSVVLGRTHHSDIAVPDDMISGVHLALTVEGDSVDLKDLGSSNGTFIDGAAIKEATLRSGDEFVAGRTTFRLRAPENREVVDITKKAEPSEEILDERRGGTEPNLGADWDKVPSPKQPVEEQVAFVSESKSVDEVSISEKTPVVIRDIEFDFNSIRSRWPYAIGLQDQDPQVRIAALLAATFTRQTWLLDFCRSVTVQPGLKHLAEYTLFAILGDGTDLEAFRRLLTSSKLGTTRFRLVGTYGHPQLIESLFEESETETADGKTQAMLAFGKITGLEVPSGSEPAGLRSLWEPAKSKVEDIQRISRGVVIESDTVNSVSDQLDTESELELQIRETYLGLREPQSTTLFWATRYLTACVSYGARAEQPK